MSKEKSFAGMYLAKPFLLWELFNKRIEAISASRSLHVLPLRKLYMYRRIRYQ